MRTLLVTGGAGFIGSHLVDALLEQGFRVRVLDDCSTGSPANLEHQSAHPGLQFIRGDVRDAAALATAVQGVDTVFHLAALGSVPRSVASPVDSHEVNVTGTLRVLTAAREAAVRRVVFAGSSSVYGNSDAPFKVETLVPRPESPYAAGKLAAEHYCRAFSSTYGIQTVILRYFNVFGPRQNPLGAYAAALPKFMAAILKGEPPVVYGDGEQTRDFTYVDNVVRASLLAAEVEGIPAGEPINVACGESTSLNTVLAVLEALTGTKVIAKHLPPRPGDVRHSMADISRARRLLGFNPTIQIRQGLERTFAWLRRSGVGGEHP